MGSRMGLPAAIEGGECYQFAVMGGGVVSTGMQKKVRV